MYVEELPCDVKEIPDYLRRVLISTMFDEEEKYSAIERFTMALEGSRYGIEWTELPSDGYNKWEEEIEWMEENSLTRST